MIGQLHLIVSVHLNSCLLAPSPKKDITAHVIYENYCPLLILSEMRARNVSHKVITIFFLGICNDIRKWWWWWLRQLCGCLSIIIFLGFEGKTRASSSSLLFLTKDKKRSMLHNDHFMGRKQQQQRHKGRALNRSNKWSPKSRRSHDDDCKMCITSPKKAMRKSCCFLPLLLSLSLPLLFSLLLPLFLGQMDDDDALRPGNYIWDSRVEKHQF